MGKKIGPAFVRVQDGPEPSILDLKIEKWAAWLQFGIVMELCSLLWLSMEFLHTPKQYGWVWITGLFILGLLCFWRSRMYYKRKIARIH